MAGVRTQAGEELRADLVVDAMGRRTRSAEWIERLGARPPQVHAEDKGFVYYTRYFTGPTARPAWVPPLMPLGSMSVLTLVRRQRHLVGHRLQRHRRRPAEGAAPRRLLRPRRARLPAAGPLARRRTDHERAADGRGARPRCRRFVVDGRPVVTGLAAVGDAWACTNPSAGRGLSVGLLHAQVLRQVVAAHLADPATFAQEWDARTAAEVAPYVGNQMRADRRRVAEMTALREGREPPAPDPDDDPVPRRRPDRPRRVPRADRDGAVHRAAAGGAGPAGDRAAGRRGRRRAAPAVAGTGPRATVAVAGCLTYRPVERDTGRVTSRVLLRSPRSGTRRGAAAARRPRGWAPSTGTG